jgi:hypothetical protein
MDTGRTPLPELSELPPRLHDFPSIVGAYPQILNLERNEQAAYSRDPSDRGKRLIYARILGYLILEGPSDHARVAVALEVNACNDDEKLLAIGQLYFNHYIRACKLQNVCLFFAILESSSTVRMNLNKGSTPVPSNYASPTFFERDTRKLKSLKAMIMDMVVEAPQNHEQAKANVSDTDHVISTQYTNIPLFKALVRDGFRCVISGQYDITSVQDNKELELEVERNADAFVSFTKCAHIFPANISGSDAQGGKVYLFPTYLDVFPFIAWT